MMIDAPNVPYRAGGKVSFLNLPVANGPGNKGSSITPTGQPAGKLGPGRWALDPRSTIPFVNVRTQEAKELTWGETIDIPENQSATVTNASYHAGDAWFTAVNDFACPARPGTITLTAEVQLTTGGSPRFVTRWIDVRLARRVFIVCTSLSPGASPGVAITFATQARERGQGAAAGTKAATSGNGQILTVQAIIGTNVGPINVGMAANARNDGTNTLSDLVPSALLDQVQVSMGQVDGNASGFNTTADTYFVLEY